MCLRHYHRLHGDGVRNQCGSVRRRCCLPVSVSDCKSQRSNPLEILTARKSVNADCGPRIRAPFPLRRPAMIAKFVSRLYGRGGGGDARSLHRAVILWCCNVAMKKKGLGEKDGKMGREPWKVANDCDQIRWSSYCTLGSRVARCGEASQSQFRCAWCLSLTY
jgi:hypothetical protein